MKNGETLDQLLDVHWLRPETAMWRELDIRAMRAFDFVSPSLDLGCGDGTFSFIRAGGRFDAEFDAFRSTARLNEFFNNVDVFDHFDEAVRPSVTRRPDYLIDCGFDHKENLLKKAGLLDFYGKSIVGDANQPLPFPNESFSSVFSNIVYWLDNPARAISEIARILKPSGRACLMLPSEALPEYSFYNRLYLRPKDENWKFLEVLDRGRFADNIRQARPAADWEQMFRAAGLRVAHHQMHLSKEIVQIWDIGLRPLFPVLQKISNVLSVEQRKEIKKEWVQVLRGFVEPLVELDASLCTKDRPGFHCYIIEK